VSQKEVNWAKQYTRPDLNIKSKSEKLNIFKFKKYYQVRVGAQGPKLGWYDQKMCPILGSS
jgi:hypothetical protein